MRIGAAAAIFRRRRPEWRTENERTLLSELFIVVGLKAKAGKEDDLRRDLSVLVEPSRREDGNIRYDLFEDQDEHRPV